MLRATLENVPLIEILCEPQREDYGDLMDLYVSIKTNGLINPITLEKLKEPREEKKYLLLTGERRLRAIYQGGTQEGRSLRGIIIPARIYTNLDPAKRLLIKKHENTKRKQLTPIEEGILLKKFSRAYEEKYGEIEERSSHEDQTIKLTNEIEKLSPTMKAILTKVPHRKAVQNALKIAQEILSKEV